MAKSKGARIVITLECKTPEGVFTGVHRSSPVFTDFSFETHWAYWALPRALLS